MRADLRIQLSVLRARYDEDAVSPAVYAVIKRIETDISWCEHFKISWRGRLTSSERFG